MWRRNISGEQFPRPPAGGERSQLISDRAPVGGEYPDITVSSPPPGAVGLCFCSDISSIKKSYVLSERGRGNWVEITFINQHIRKNLRNGGCKYVEKRGFFLLVPLDRAKSRNYSSGKQGYLC